MEDFYKFLFDENEINKELTSLKEDIFEECWNFLNRDPELILENFIIYVDQKYTYAIPPDGMDRSIFLDHLIKHFEEKEHFEKCSHLLKIKNKVEKDF